MVHGSRVIARTFIQQLLSSEDVLDILLNAGYFKNEDNCEQKWLLCSREMKIKKQGLGDISPYSLF